MAHTKSTWGAFTLRTSAWIRCSRLALRRMRGTRCARVQSSTSRSMSTPHASFSGRRRTHAQARAAVPQKSSRNRVKRLPRWRR